MDLGSFTSGLLTGLREGVEAALIVSIILAYLARTGRRHQPGRSGSAPSPPRLSLVVGIILFITVGAFEEPYEQIFEGITMLIAAAVVTWMLFWMRRQARSVKGELQAAVDRALEPGRRLGPRPAGLHRGDPRGPRDRRCSSSARRPRGRRRRAAGARSAR